MFTSRSDQMKGVLTLLLYVILPPGKNSSLTMVVGTGQERSRPRLFSQDENTALHDYEKYHQSELRTVCE